MLIKQFISAIQDLILNIAKRFPWTSAFYKQASCSNVSRLADNTSVVCSGARTEIRFCLSTKTGSRRGIVQHCSFVCVAGNERSNLTRKPHMCLALWFFWHFQKKKKMWMSDDTNLFQHHTQHVYNLAYHCGVKLNDSPDYEWLYLL